MRTRSWLAGRSGVLEERRQRALRMRVDAAEGELGDGLPERVTNGDEGEYPLGLVSFSKALPHNTLGEVDADAYRTLLRALDSGRRADFEAIPLAGATKLTNPEGAFAFEPEGPDPWSVVVEPPPRFASEAFAGETIECYWLALVLWIGISVTYRCSVRRRLGSRVCRRGVRGVW